MELYRQSTHQISFEAPEAGTAVSANASLNGGDPVPLVIDSPEAGSRVRTTTLPYVADEGRVTVGWTFTVDTFNGPEYITVNENYDFITPVLPLSEIRRIMPNSTDAERIAVERATRHIINAHTGQSFGFEKEKALRIEAHGENALRLPKRLVRLTGLATQTAILEPNSAIVVSDGWYLKKGWSHEVARISSNSTYWDGGSQAAPANDHDDDGFWTLPVSGEPGYEKTGHGLIISAPGSRQPTVWRDDYGFTITGDWGYEEVPAQVKEAARLLANDYGCREAAYRDRYLDSIKAADWRLQYNEQAWERTGNARADHLLSEFVIMDWAVI